ncbi:squalene/phytoene synthase family protein [Brachybacterium huguangmaarense]|uniref:Squalene/phytoene synthase family protein n=1 Tax=Brachybacterium huguangmaarense TaxID=1652028 RepID=A0ABY6G2N2_9MICO|nr:squalene/phytoene synthase family protein [Brachybacterium huguangmaarense]UYG17459.1 squalene/phytoene synthase family protein [Brachybacterium huguangmaarense]
MEPRRRVGLRRPARTALDDYDRAAEAAAATVIARYSTSFGLATRLLHGVVRRRTRSVYALVRVADEIVDGAAAGAGLGPDVIAQRLDDYERETETALATGFSTDLVVHAFATAARATGIGTDLTRPFFAAMRADLAISAHTEDTFERYVYGSAEVVGLMCLRVFMTDAAETPVEPPPHLVTGARRLGAAFQKVNFLRDLAADVGERGRAYFPGVDPVQLDDADRDRLLADIDADLAAARAVIDELPGSSRLAVLSAHDLFAELSRCLARVPASTLLTTRVRVPDARKALVVARAAAVERRGRGARPRTGDEARRASGSGGAGTGP